MTNLDAVKLIQHVISHCQCAEDDAADGADLGDVLLHLSIAQSTLKGLINLIREREPV